ncbi:hypothetical protein ABZ636_05760 [Streptomyces sp. NPDC007251]|uniref:hypothetical protein n=1 Tax=unclassified Streptomyces TaxID=2593676 RepID=UPI00340D777D
MAALAHLSFPAQAKPVAEPSADLHDAPACAFSAESACAQAPLTSEPPLPDAGPLTSEPPLADATPLTSESDAYATPSYEADDFPAPSYAPGVHGTGA